MAVVRLSRSSGVNFDQHLLTAEVRRVIHPEYLGALPPSARSHRWWRPIIHRQTFFRLEPPGAKPFLRSSSQRLVCLFLSFSTSGRENHKGRSGEQQKKLQRQHIIQRCGSGEGTTAVNCAPNGQEKRLRSPNWKLPSLRNANRTRAEMGLENRAAPVECFSRKGIKVKYRPRRTNAAISTAASRYSARDLRDHRPRFAGPTQDGRR